MPPLPITRVVLYKHGVGYFEREGPVEGDAALTLTFKQSEVSDVLKSLTVLDLDGGHVASVSYDSTKPLEQLLAEVALEIPDEGSLVHLLPQVKGARVRVQPGRTPSLGMAAPGGGEAVEGIIVGIDTQERQTADGITRAVLLSLLTDGGDLRLFDLHALARLEILDTTLRRDLDFYLRTQLSAKKKDARTFTFFTQGAGRRTVRLSYTLEAPVWKATYRILLGEEERPPTIQGWAVVDNTQDEDWENVTLSLVAGLPVSFVHDLYTPRYIKRPVVAVKETTGVLPPEVESGIDVEAFPVFHAVGLAEDEAPAAAPPAAAFAARARSGSPIAYGGKRREPMTAVSSTPAQVRERKLGDLFEYEIERPVTIRRNQSALVPIVLRGFEGRPVLLYNRATRADNPMRAVELKNTTGLTLEGGPLTVLEGGSYVGEAMMETTKPDEQRLIPYAVELAVKVMDSIDTHQDDVSRVVLRDGILTACRLHVQQTTCTFDNKADAGQVVYLDHPRAGEAELFDTPPPHEVTDSFWRFRFDLPAKKVTRFVVRQRTLNRYAYGLAETYPNVLAGWIEQRYFDDKTAKAVKAIIDLRGQAEALARQLQQLQQEREQIHAEQKRIRDNLSSLGDRPSEKELRERFVRTLNAQEDRLEKIERERQERQAEHDRTQEQIRVRVGELAYEADVPRQR